MTAIPVAQRMANYRARKRAREARTRPGPVTLRVTCWCEATVLDVPTVEVRACRTRSCGAPDCRGDA